MKIYDISQEVFGGEVYPGDPAPQKRVLKSISHGELYQLTAFEMCAHNGTHVDAPRHFIGDGKTVDEITLEAFVGKALVVEHQGALTAADAVAILEKARSRDGEAARRILVKGNATVTLEAAEVFAKADLLLLGNESQSVGPVEAPMAVHIALLRAEVILLEGIRLGEVPEGVYFLSAAPLNLAGLEGAPCRALLIDMDQ